MNCRLLLQLGIQTVSMGFLKQLEYLIMLSDIQKIRMIENASKITVYSQGNTMMMVSVILKSHTISAIKVRLVALCGYDDTAKIMDLS